jgi:hypothetical protein
MAIGQSPLSARPFTLIFASRGKVFGDSTELDWFNQLSFMWLAWRMR